MYCTQISVSPVFNKRVSGLRATRLTRLQISEPSKLLQPLGELIRQNSAIEYPRLHDHWDLWSYPLQFPSPNAISTNIASITPTRTNQANHAPNAKTATFSVTNPCFFDTSWFPVTQLHLVWIYVSLLVVIPKASQRSSSPLIMSKRVHTLCLWRSNRRGNTTGAFTRCCAPHCDCFLFPWWWRGWRFWVFFQSCFPLPWRTCVTLCYLCH